MKCSTVKGEQSKTSSLATKQLELLNAKLYLPKGRKETPPEVTKNTSYKNTSYKNKTKNTGYQINITIIKMR